MSRGGTSLAGVGPSWAGEGRHWLVRHAAGRAGTKLAWGRCGAGVGPAWSRHGAGWSWHINKKNWRQCDLNWARWNTPTTSNISLWWFCDESTRKLLRFISRFLNDQEMGQLSLRWRADAGLNPPRLVFCSHTEKAYTKATVNNK